MEEDQDKPSEAVPSSIPKPAIPPPDLSRPAPGPLSPLEKMPKPDISPPAPPIPVSNPVPPALKKSAVVEDDEDEEEEEVPTGAVPFNTRLIAAVIDVGVAAGVVIMLTFLLPFLGRSVWLIYIGYMLTRDSLPFLGGQSIGKKAMKIQVVTAAGESLSGKWEPSLIRNISTVVLPLTLVELFLLLSREEKPERGRRLGDEWAKTKVIFEPKPVKAEPEA